MTEYIVNRENIWPYGSQHEEVVRCKDCEYFETDYTDGVMLDETVCWAWDNGHDYPSFTNPNGFCHRGKRKEGR